MRFNTRLFNAAKFGETGAVYVSAQGQMVVWAQADTCAGVAVLAQCSADVVSRADAATGVAVLAQQEIQVDASADVRTSTFVVAQSAPVELISTIEVSVATDFQAVPAITEVLAQMSALAYERYKALYKSKISEKKILKSRISVE